MKTDKQQKVWHYDPARPCCESTSEADLFPDLEHLKYNVENCGRVASILVKSIGIGIQQRKLTIDEQGWRECFKHPNFRACHDLAMAKLAMQKELLAL